MRTEGTICGVFLLSLISFQAVNSQNVEDRREYIRTYARYAVEEMYYSKIPASITMAQAIVESNYGVSELARVANNHFGIKCQQGWTGGRMYYDDDKKNDCFRVYDNVIESFRDHSDFLMTRPWYKPLFELEITDYKGWAHGLKKAGYETNPNYAHMLIRVIDDNRLDEMDSWLPEIKSILANTDVLVTSTPPRPESPKPKVYSRNRIDFVVAREGDTSEHLTEVLDKLRWEIRKYNELAKNQNLKPGQIVYLQPKRMQAESGFNAHRAQLGETMYSISQQFGIKLRALYRLNGMTMGTQPDPGQLIWLRKKHGTVE